MGHISILSFSLIKGNHKVYTMHPLVHAWSRTRLNDLEQVSHCSKTRTILACSIEPDHAIKNYELWKAC
jgi:hypothetical protein